jgi:hypothetical protein
MQLPHLIVLLSENVTVKRNIVMARLLLDDHQILYLQNLPVFNSYIWNM